MTRPIYQYLFLFLLNLSIALAASPTTFCKCACFTNSTIIPLDGSVNTPQTTSTSNSTSQSFYRTCNDCNKQFCLSLDLPICKDATEDDVFTTCFQRDSAKDEAVVFIFIFATVGLLAWAAVKPWVVRWRGRWMGRGYVGVGGQGGT